MPVRLACCLCLVTVLGCLAQEAEPPDRLAAARAAKAAGDLRTARTEARAVLQANPDNAEAWWLVAWIEAGLGDRPAALAAFGQAADLLPPEDERLGTAQRKADQLRAELRPLPPRRPPVEPVPPAPPRFTFGNAWPGVVLLAALLASLIAGGRAALLDWRDGRGSPAARFADLCLRAGAGRPVSVRELFALAEADTLRTLPDHDLALAVNLAAGLGEESRAELAALVRAGSGRQRSIAAQALARQAAQPDPTVWRPLLDEQEVGLQRAALQALRQQPDAGAVDPLRRLALGHQPELAVDAVAALAGLGGDRAAEALGEVATSAAVAEARPAALAALGERRRLPDSLVRSLTPLLRGDEATKLAVLACFATIGDRARRRLLAATLEPSAAVRRAAREALLANRHGHFAQPEAEWAGPLLRFLAGAREPTDEALEVAIAWAPGEALPLVERALGADLETPAGQALRRRAVAWLAVADQPEAGRLLRQALEAMPSEGLSPVAAAHLGELVEAVARRGVVEALPTLVARLAAARDDEALQAACRALAADPGAGAALAVAASDPRPSVRAVAIDLLARHPAPEAAEALLAELDRGGHGAVAWPTVLRAAQALCELGDKRAVRSLLKLRDRHEEARCDALDVVLARLDEPEAKRRVEAMLVRPSWAGRRPAADYFRHLREPPPRAAAVVREAAAHEQAEAMAADPDVDPARLAELGADVQPTLEDWLFDADRREVAAAALARLGDAEAKLRAERLWRIDELAQRRGDEAARAELAELARGADELLLDYLKARLGADEARRLVD